MNSRSEPCVCPQISTGVAIHLHAFHRGRDEIGGPGRWSRSHVRGLGEDVAEFVVESGVHGVRMGVVPQSHGRRREARHGSAPQGARRVGRRGRIRRMERGCGAQDVRGLEQGVIQDSVLIVSISVARSSEPPLSSITIPDKLRLRCQGIAIRMYAVPSF